MDVSYYSVSLKYYSKSIANASRYLQTAYFPCIMHSKVLPETKVLLSKYVL